MNKRDTILLVDDMEINRAILRNVFENEYHILEAENGRQAMLLLEQYHGQISAMLLDLVMPEMNGYQVMEEIAVKNYLSEFPVVVITAEGSVENEVQVFDLGASDIIMKPFEPHVVKRRVQNIVELNLHKLYQQELIDQQSMKLRESNAVMIDALSSIIEYRSVETGQHIQRIRMFTQVLLEDVAQSYPEFGLTDKNISIIVSASSMHDIGKIAIPDSILNKPGRLTSEEFEIMKTHSVKGCEMLAKLDRMSDKEYLQYAYNICRYHHERWDGKGYPDGLKGDSIPVCAQVVGIADCYDALTTDRVYKKALPPEQAFNMILNGECGVFSPKLLESFKNVRMAFAGLSLEYSDQNHKNAGALKPKVKTPVLTKESESLDTLQLGQIKYFTILRYTGSTVMEVDLNTGMFHVVYLSSPDFDSLKTGNRFEESIRNFAKEAVHPDDRKMVISLLDDYMQEFFQEGYMKRSRKYRIYNKLSKTYQLCDATLLRIDTGYPHQRKAMLIWNTQRDHAVISSLPADDLYLSAIQQSLLGIIQQFKNDQWFTMPEVSEGLLQLLGYCREEMQEQFQNRLYSVIHPSDRKELMKKIKDQLKAGSQVTAEYRVIAKDNRMLWVLEKSQMVTASDGTEYFLSVLNDITSSKQAQEELRLMLERHKILMEQTNDIIFEWDMRKDSIIFSNNWQKMFGYPSFLDMASSKFLNSFPVYPEDIPLLEQLLEQLKGSAPYAEIDFRLADVKGRYRWCKIRATVQFDNQNKPIKSIGVITDIDKEKRISQELRERAERDELTGLYNKNVAKTRINHYLQNRKQTEKSAMLILDIDDFKQINDTYGHMFGDVVLQEISSELKNLFRNADILSRVGGDEFLIFMKEIPNADIMKDRMNTVLCSLRKLFQSRTLQNPLSCSIGMAVCPNDGVQFEALFHHSDLALYYAKSTGKNKFQIYDATCMSRSFEEFIIDSKN